MKKILIIFLLSSFPYSYAADKPTEKSTSVKVENENPDELALKIEEEVEKRLKKVSGNNVVKFSQELIEKEKLLKLERLQLEKEKEVLGQTIKDQKKKAEEFQAEQKRFFSCIDANDAKKNDRIKKMVDVVSNMRPQSASDLLSVQEGDLAVGILEQLDPAKVSKIFNLMDKSKSAELQKLYMTQKVQ